MKSVLTAFWRLFQAYLFYPVLIGVFLWLYFTGAHWIFGLAVIVAILVFDPMWGILARNILRLFKK